VGNKVKMRFKVFLCSLLIAHCSLFFVSCTTFSTVIGSEVVTAASPEAVSPRWTPVPAALGLTEGLDYFAGKVSRPRIEFYALRIDLTASNLRMAVSAGGGRYREGFLSVKVSSFVRNNGLLAGVNALPFDPVSGTEGEPRTNVGIVVADGVTLSPPHKSFDALVFYKDGHAAIVSQSEIKINDNDNNSDNIENAVGGFYRILEHGELAARVLNLDDSAGAKRPRHPRSAAGISPDNKFLYFIVIDGRQLKSIGCTEAETALLLRALGATEAINFDGGGSSALAIRCPDGKVRVVNTPIHGQIPGRERAVAGCLGIGGSPISTVE
jgi:hypothetical protein